MTPPKVGAPKLSVGPGGLDVKGPQIRAPQVRVPKAKAINLSRPTLGLRALKQSGTAGAEGAMPLLPKQAVFGHKAWLPWWLSIAVPIVALLGVLAFLLLPKHVTVPDVVGSASAYDAQSKLTKAGLVLGTKEPKVSADAEPGSVLSQTPEADADVKKGSVVNIEIATSTEETTVPDLAGLTYFAATKKLRARKLSKGAPRAGDGARPRREGRHKDPPAGEPVKRGTPIDIFFADQKRRRQGRRGRERAPAAAVVLAAARVVPRAARSRFPHSTRRT